MTLQVTSLLLSLLLCTLSSNVVVTASSVVKDSKILVHIPFQIHEPNGFDHIKADFGFGSILNDYQSLSQYVYWIEQTLCTPVTNQSIGYPTIEEGHTWETPFILLINGGGICSHVTKVRNGQMIGASAVILAQPHCSCSDTNCTASYPNDVAPNCEDDTSVATVLLNDGSASDISIPSFYLMKHGSELIKEKLRQNQPVLMELQWGISESIFTNENDNKPSIHFWSIAYDPHVRVETYNDIRTIISAFTDHIDFIPHYSIMDGHRFNCIGVSSDNSPCDHLCSNNGRYCTNHATDLSGHAILNETLRRSCIWDHTIHNSKEMVMKGSSSNPTDKFSMYWEYVLYHKKECSKYPSTFADEKCRNDAMKHANIDHKSIETCMINSGDMDIDIENTYFENTLTEQKQLGIITLPSLVFNNHVLYHTSGYALFDVICEEYWRSNVRVVPDICIKCSSCPNTIGCVSNHGKCTEFNNNERIIIPTDDSNHNNNNNNNNQSPKKKSYFWSRFFWIVFFGIAFGAAYYYYETHIKDVRRSNSRPLMNDYLHLNMDG